MKFTCRATSDFGSPGSGKWFTNNGNNDASKQPGHSTLTVRRRYGRFTLAPIVVTNVLTVTNVNICNNGADYICVQGNSVSRTVFLIVLGE